MGQVQPSCQTAPDLRARDSERPGIRGRFVFRHVFAAIRQVNHSPERQNLDTKLRVVLPKKCLRVIRIVEGTTVWPKPGPGMVPAHDETGWRRSSS